MTWFDAVVGLLVAGVVLFEARREAGRALLDAVAALLAAQNSGPLAADLTVRLGWQPLPGSDSSPLLLGASCLLLLGAGLLLSALFHRHTRWSMDQFDLCFGVAFGILIAVAVGHMFADVTARMVVMREGRAPGWLAESLLGEELRSFRSYHYVVDVCNGLRRD